MCRDGAQELRGAGAGETPTSLTPASHQLRHVSRKPHAELERAAQLTSNTRERDTLRVRAAALVLE